MEYYRPWGLVKHDIDYTGLPYSPVDNQYPTTNLAPVTFKYK
ncbi:hypothetical protein NOC27_1570 [Nitrosococcus oceani AFC27]|nr:hypothetical protein NOC27_1570 [Nitrosococcus oceani AFC27]